MAEAGLTQDERLQVQLVFNMYDTNHNGKISMQEMNRLIRCIGFDVYTFTKSEIVAMFLDVDKDNDGEITIHEFMNVFHHYMRKKKAEVADEPIINPAERAYYKRVFRKFDTDGDGTLSIEELYLMIRYLGFDAVTFPDHEIASMFVDVDVNEDGEISLHEFLTVFGQRTSKDLDIGNLTRLFNEIDTDRSGKISAQEMKVVFKKFNIKRSDAEVDVMFQSADTSGDGLIDLDEFLHIFM